MSLRQSIQILIAALALVVFASSCQQGKRKDSETLVYADGIARCEEIATELRGMGIELEGRSTVGKKDEAKLPMTLRRTESTASAQALIEEFILKSTELLKRGDNAAISFPEKNKIRTQLQRASRYLGQIYSEMEWNNEPNPVQTFEVDNEEFTARLGRISELTNRLENEGITKNFIFTAEQLKETLSKKKLNRVVEYKKIGYQLMHDYVRNKTLLERNGYFQLEGLKGFADNALHLAGIYYFLMDASKNEYKRRTGKTLE